MNSTMNSAKNSAILNERRENSTINSAMIALCKVLWIAL